MNEKKIEKMIQCLTDILEDICIDELKAEELMDKVQESDEQCKKDRCCDQPERGLFEKMEWDSYPNVVKLKSGEWFVAEKFIGKYQLLDEYFLEFQLYADIYMNHDWLEIDEFIDGGCMRRIAVNIKNIDYAFEYVS